MSNPLTNENLSRRDFVKQAGAVTAGLASFGIAKGYIERVLKVGLVGCGGRGVGAAVNNLEAQDTTIWSVGDIFPDQAAKAAKRFEIPEERTFSGWDSYIKVLDSGIDVVILATPPHFRAEHFEAAVERGIHCFIEKPVAVDPVGIRRMLKAGEVAKEKGLAVVAGTQRRHQISYQECQQRIADGAIGRIVHARANWWQGDLWRRGRKAEWSDMEFQIRNWLYFSWLSGDHIVEQHVHNIDIINWFMGSHPVRCFGMGGRTIRTDIGNIYDHFTITYEYPNGAQMVSQSGQCTKGWGDVSEFLIGEDGTCNANGEINGVNQWKFQGAGLNAYLQEHIDLIEAVRLSDEEEPINETQNVSYSVLTAIMGRQAAYTGKMVTWNEIMNSNLRLGPTKYEWGPVPVDPVPVPEYPA